MSADDKLYKLKVILLGDAGVGKTAITMRFTANNFEQYHKATLGASYMSKTVVIDDKVIAFQIWDTAGQERFKSLVPMYVRGAHIAMIVYDVTDPESFANVSAWLETLQHHADMIQTVIVGNKCDMDREVDDYTAVCLAQEHGIRFVYVSAKTGFNVERLFHSMGTRAVDMLKRSAVKETDNTRISLVQLPEYRTNSRHKKKCSLI